MFNWFKKKNKILSESLFHEQEIKDAIEESLWEIKEEYDLPTEEVLNVVQSKRKNLDYMHKALSKKTTKENL
jgi:chorismate mutase